MSFSSPIAEKIYIFMNSICSPIGDFLNDFSSELKEVWLHSKKEPAQEPQDLEEEKFNEKQALIKLKSFKSVKKGSLLYFGIEDSGKTSLLNRFTRKNDEKIAPTQGFNVYTLQFHGFLLTCWDFGGNQKLRIYWENYINEDVSGIIYMLDGNNEEKIKENLDVLIMILNLIIVIIGKPLPILVFANKSDKGMKVNVNKFVEDVKNATNYEGTMLAEEGSVLQWLNIEESMGYFLEFIK